MLLILIVSGGNGAAYPLRLSESVACLCSQQTEWSGRMTGRGKRQRWETGRGGGEREGGVLRNSWIAERMSSDGMRRDIQLGP